VQVVELVAVTMMVIPSLVLEEVVSVECEVRMMQMQYPQFKILEVVLQVDSQHLAQRILIVAQMELL
jgi:hypothetical protein